MPQLVTAPTEAGLPHFQIENLYGRLVGLRRLRGPITSQSAKDFNWILATLRDARILTKADVLSFRLNELAGIQEALFSGLPERAGQLIALLEKRCPRLNASEDLALLQWAIRDGVVLAVVVSDISDSTHLSAQLGNSKWHEAVSAFVKTSQELASRRNGFFIKTSGDDSLVAFRDTASALDFAIELHHAASRLQFVLHQGLHVGKVVIEAADIGGLEVTLAYRVAAWAKGGMIAATDAFKMETKHISSDTHGKLPWKKCQYVPLKGIKQKLTLWEFEPEPQK